MTLFSVILPTHNPDRGRLRRTLEGLSSQTLPPHLWELLVIDNASSDAVTLGDQRGENWRVVSESTLGLSHARARGFREGKGAFALLVDDDNVLAPDYLERCVAGFARLPKIGLVGGRSLPEFERPPEPWNREFHSLLALRDLGSDALLSTGLRPPGTIRNEYPAFAPIGAGMALRREAWTAWLDRGHASALSDRTGRALTSGGDNDIVLTAMAAGWEVAYLPELALTHLIPASRLEPQYLARLNRGIQCSWMQVLALHDANPWPPLSRAGVLARQLRAWFVHRPWSSAAARVRFAGVCGHFEGRVPR